MVIAELVENQGDLLIVEEVAQGLWKRIHEHVKYKYNDGTFTWMSYRRTTLAWGKSDDRVDIRLLLGGMHTDCRNCEQEPPWDTTSHSCVLSDEPTEQRVVQLLHRYSTRQETVHEIIFRRFFQLMMKREMMHGKHGKALLGYREPGFVGLHHVLQRRLSHRQNSRGFCKMKTLSRGMAGKKYTGGIGLHGGLPLVVLHQRRKVPLALQVLLHQRLRLVPNRFLTCQAPHELLLPDRARREWGT